MSDTVPTMDIKAIFRDFRNPHSAKPHPTEAIKAHAQKFGRGIHTKYQLLRSIVFPHLDELLETWQEMIPDERTSILAKAWPGIPGLHRPEAFGPDKDKSLEYYIGKTPPNRYMLPFLNVQDLQDEKSFLVLVDTRCRHPPHTLASTELNFAPHGLVDQGPMRAPSLKMQLDDPDNYGVTVSFASEVEATNFESDGKGLSPVAGLQVLYMQDKLLSFLVSAVKLVLSEQLEGASTEHDLFEPAIPSDLYDEDPMAMFDVAAKEPFRPRKGLQLDRLEQLVLIQSQMAHDRVWDIREDPRLWEALYNTTSDHDEAQILDDRGRPDSVMKTSKFTAAILHDVVVRSHYNLILWDQLHALLEKIKVLYEASPEGIVVETMEPSELVEAIQCLHLALENLRIMTVQEVAWYKASPGLRSQFVRMPFAQVMESKNYEKDPIKYQLCHLLARICGQDLGNVDNVVAFSDTRYYLDVLETFLRTPQGTKAREYISDLINDAIAKLWVLTEVEHRFAKQPWHLKVVGVFLQKDQGKTVLERLSGPTTAWDKVFEKAAETGFITSPELGKPGTQFYYDIDAKKNRKRAVNMLCKAEANLDRFWNHVDTNLNAIVDNYQQGVLQRLLDERGDMHRTIPWSERDHSKDAKQVPFKEAFDFKHQPLSNTFHDSSTEITGSFDKSLIIEKTKEKTRGTPAAAEEPAEPAREPSPEAAIEFAVGKHSYEAFRALFHMPGEAPVASVRWNDVVGALTDIGFSAQHLHGSQWQFNPVAAPVAELDLKRGISFHAPHPGDEVPLELARRYGRRLSRAYGWEGTMFKEE